MFEWLQLGRLAQSGLYSQGECKPLRMMAQINNKQGHSTSLGHVRNTKKAKSSLICPPPYPYKSFLARHCNTLESWRLLFSKVWGEGVPNMHHSQAIQQREGNLNCNSISFNPGATALSPFQFSWKCPGPFSWSSSMFIWNRSIWMEVLINVELVFHRSTARCQFKVMNRIKTHHLWCGWW